MAEQTETPTDIQRHTFRSMATAAELIVRDTMPDAELRFAEVVAELDRLQALLTRFNRDSELELINDAGGGIPGPELREVLEAALRGFQQSEGRFDISIGAALIAEGYDRTFDDLSAIAADPGRAAARGMVDDPSGVTSEGSDEDDGGWLLEPPPPRDPGFTLHADGRLEIRDGRRLDLGGIAKGWAVDRACQMLSEHGSCLVNIGGDIAVHVVDGEDPWPVGIEVGSEVNSYALSWGGVATSGQDRRAWASPTTGERVHHVIDPRTGRSAATDIWRVTVFGATCMEAEIWTKALMVDGSEAAIAEATARGLTAIFVRLDDSVVLTGGLA